MTNINVLGGLVQCALRYVCSDKYDPYRFPPVPTYHNTQNTIVTVDTQYNALKEVEAGKHYINALKTILRYKAVRKT